MPRYIFAYHGGSMPETEEEGAKVMAAWTDWYAAMGGQLADGGAAAGRSMTVHSDGSVSNDGGANPFSGYTVVSADSHDAANAIAKGCPILAAGGSVEVCELIEM